jgi:hypothetical protein
MRIGICGYKYKYFSIDIEFYVRWLDNMVFLSRSRYMEVEATATSPFFHLYYTRINFLPFDVSKPIRM